MESQCNLNAPQFVDRDHSDLSRVVFETFLNLRPVPFEQMVPEMGVADCQLELLSMESRLRWPLTAVPIAVAGDFDVHEHPWYASGSVREECTYQNAATCPDCSAGMIRQGRCCVCPSCGFESCLV